VNKNGFLYPESTCAEIGNIEGTSKYIPGAATLQLVNMGINFPVIYTLLLSIQNHKYLHQDSGISQYV
jgi:hypothetical protein